MEGLRHPVGEQPAQTYWKRRLIAGVALIVVIALLWWIVASLVGGSDEQGSTPGASDDATTTAPASDDADAALGQACSPSDVTVTTTANPTSVAAGELPVFDVSVAHAGENACLLDTDAEGTELLITSGPDRIYSSLDCPDDQTIESTQLLLEPGATENLSITWNRQRSLPECATETAEPGAGTYNAALSLQGIPSEPAVFNLE